MLRSLTCSCSCFTMAVRLLFCSITEETDLFSICSCLLVLLSCSRSRSYLSISYLECWLLA